MPVNWFSWFRVGSVAEDEEMNAAESRMDRQMERVEAAAKALSEEIQERNKPLRRVK